MDKQHIASCFSKAALTYDKHAVIQRRVAEALSVLIEKHKSLLDLPVTGICDLGCGTGFLTEYLCRRFPASQILATDIAPEMLEQCLLKLGHYTNLNVCIHDADLSELPQTFDFVTSNLALQWVNLIASLPLIWRSTAKCLCFSVLCDGTFVEWRDLFAHFNVPDPVISFIGFEALKQILAQLTGVKQVVMQQAQLKQDFVDVLSFLRHLKAIGAHYSPHVKQNDVLASASGLRRMVKFGVNPEGFSLTYQVAYCLLTK